MRAPAAHGGGVGHWWQLDQQAGELSSRRAWRWNACSSQPHASSGSSVDARASPPSLRRPRDLAAAATALRLAEAEIADAANLFRLRLVIEISRSKRRFLVRICFHIILTFYFLQMKQSIHTKIIRQIHITRHRLRTLPPSRTPRRHCPPLRLTLQ